MHSTFLFIHIASGAIAILSGFLSLIPKKGGKWHILLGKLFFYSMIVMAGMACVLATFFAFETINALIGLFTLYLVLTAKFAAANRDGRTSIREKILGLFALLLFLGFLFISISAYQSGRAAIDGVYVEAYYVYTFFAALALGLDIKVILKGGIRGKQRIARHLWRMVLALFIASGSVFLGQPQVFPKVIQTSGALNVPVLIVVLVLIFWMVRVFLGRRFA